ncbi:hypothetical protein M3Y94_00727700 [Aphelenchoides besseyi]|nr:hypothetical protein M3Y94_00727700 [Aphelenchoides besseyi]
MIRYGPPSNLSLLKCIGIIFALLFTGVVMSTIAMLSANPSIAYERLWTPEVPIPPLGVLDQQQSPLVFIGSTYFKVVLLGGFLVSVFIAFRSYRFLKRNAAEVNRLRSMDRLVFVQVRIQAES